MAQGRAPQADAPLTRQREHHVLDSAAAVRRAPGPHTAHRRTAILLARPSAPAATEAVAVTAAVEAAPSVAAAAARVVASAAAAADGPAVAAAEAASVAADNRMPHDIHAFSHNYSNIRI